MQLPETIEQAVREYLMTVAGHLSALPETKRKYVLQLLQRQFYEALAAVAGGEAVTLVHLQIVAKRFGSPKACAARVLEEVGDATLSGVDTRVGVAASGSAGPPPLPSLQPPESKPRESQSGAPLWFMVRIDAASGPVRGTFFAKAAPGGLVLRRLWSPWNTVATIPQGVSASSDGRGVHVAWGQHEVTLFPLDNLGHYHDRIVRDLPRYLSGRLAVMCRKEYVPSPWLMLAAVLPSALGFGVWSLAPMQWLPYLGALAAGIAAMWLVTREKIDLTFRVCAAVAVSIIPLVLFLILHGSHLAYWVSGSKPVPPQAQSPSWPKEQPQVEFTFVKRDPVTGRLVPDRRRNNPTPQPGRSLIQSKRPSRPQPWTADRAIAGITSDDTGESVQARLWLTRHHKDIPAEQRPALLDAIEEVLQTGQNRAMGLVEIYCLYADSKRARTLVELASGKIDRRASTRAVRRLVEVSPRKVRRVLEEQADDRLFLMGVQRELQTLGPEHEKTILSWLKSSNPRVVELAVDVLEKVGTPRAVPALRKVLKANSDADADSRHVQWQVKRVIAAIEKRSTP